ncbi:GNAT family N-acetyltransferase [Thalassotalea marina]|uniref:N-acetyltransferase n=1 Tax=Thalassotalea marina TaxID=1673741 RepID=A0A919ELU1_9GAMM|nr:GNAT family N-acetyltransferase [Thalassotalea marina]GHF97787.1 N-acetyltransferase [Thalassotalea marina]
MKIDLINQKRTIHTERFTITSLDADDWPLFFDLQNNSELMHFIRPVQPEHELRAKFLVNIGPWTGNPDHWHTHKIVCKETGNALGTIGFKVQCANSMRFELGYILYADFQGQGVITEAGQALVEFLFNTLNVHKVVAICMAENIGSWKVMEKLGMEREAHLKQHTLHNDKWSDDLIYGLINPA